MSGRAYLGISGYQYQHWRGAFYPGDLPQRRWLEFASRQFNSIELNGTFQLPASYAFSAERVDAFLASLPRTTGEAAAMAAKRDERLKRGALCEAAVDVPLRHAMEVRHPSYDTYEFYELLRAYGCSFVLANTAGKFLYAEEITADFVYVRLHGSQELYVSR